MSCKELIPEVVLNGIGIKQQFVGQSDAVKQLALSEAADELFTIDISHTNLVQADTNLNDSITVFDLLDATTGPDGLYNAKFLITDSPARAELIRDVISTIKQVSFFLYGNPDNETNSQTADANEVKEFISNPPANAPTKAKEALVNLDKCVSEVTKATAAQAAANITAGSLLIPDLSNLAQADLSLPENADKITAIVEPQITTLRDRIVEALTDNKANKFKSGDAIASFNTTLKVDSTQIKTRLVDGEVTPVFVNNQEFQIAYSSAQLKDLFLFVVPNVEFRENEKIIFTVRDYVDVPLVKNFQPQVFGSTVFGDKKVDVDFLDQSPVFDPNKLVISTVEKVITGLLSKKAFDNWQALSKPKAILTAPTVSIGYNEKVNGVFFLNKEALAESLTSYPGILERPETYQNVLEGIIVKKVYKKSGKEVELSAPELYEGLEFSNKKACAYLFQDSYDIQDFEYVIEVRAKNPWEQLLQYVMPRLNLASSVLDTLISNVETVSPAGKLVILNPVSGYFTDDFLNSEFYQEINTSYKFYLLETLEKLYNYILPSEGIKLTSRDLVSTKQLFELKENYNLIIKTMQDIGETQGINFTTLASSSSKKKANKKQEPYRTITQKYDKPYKTPTSRVFYDFLYAEPPPETSTLSGFEITPAALVSRIETEGTLLNFFGGENNINTYKDDEITQDAADLSVTPVAIMIDDTSINLVEDLDTLEETATNALMQAELEVKNPARTFTGEENALFGLMSLDGAEIVPPLSKKLVAKTTPDEFVPTDVKNARPVITKGQRNKKLTNAFEAIFKALIATAKSELEEKAAKALYLEAANTPVPEIALQAIKKMTSNEGNPVPDEKHSYILGRTNTDNLLINGEPSFIKLLQIIKFITPFYKANPTTFVTRFMNAYQLEYVSEFNSSTNKPTYSPLTLDVINKVDPNEAVLVRMTIKAGIPVDPDYTIRHTNFIVTTDAVTISTSTPFDFLPTVADLSPGVGLQKAASALVETASVAAVAKAQETSSTTVGDALIGDVQAILGQTTPTTPQTTTTSTTRTTATATTTTRTTATAAVQPTMGTSFSVDGGSGGGFGGGGY